MSAMSNKFSSDELKQIDQAHDLAGYSDSRW